MSAIDWRGLCEELVEALEIQLDELRFDNRLCKRARAALAQPEPEVAELSDEELDELFIEIDQSGEALSWRAFARAAIAADRARWGRARAALAQPEPEVVELTDEDLWDIGERHLWTGTEDSNTETCILNSFIGAARAVLARCGRPAPAPAGEVAHAAHVRRMCEIILGNTFGNGELDSLALHVGHHPDVLNASPAAEGEVAELINELRRICFDVAPCDADTITRAADLLEQRHPAPVPVAERLPGPEDCDAEHYCWRWNTIGRLWARQPLARSWYEFESHWLPFHALPLPSVGGGA